MPILPIDSGRYGTKEMKDIFEEDRKLNYELIFESAVASAQAELSIIPKDASKNIEEVVSSNKITVQRVKELESISDHDTAAIVEAISELCSESSKPWIHYGLTSNDVVDSSTSMQMRDVFKIVESKLHQLIKELLKKSIEYQDLPAVGRTHGQHASITSFGLKFAIWSNELLDHITRINEGKKRFLHLQNPRSSGNRIFNERECIRSSKNSCKETRPLPRRSCNASDSKGEIFRNVIHNYTNSINIR